MLVRQVYSDRFKVEKEVEFGTDLKISVLKALPSARHKTSSMCEPYRPRMRLENGEIHLEQWWVSLDWI